MDEIMGYSIDLRVKVIKYMEQESDRKKVCKVFDISIRTLSRWIKKSKAGDLSDPKPRRPWKKIDPGLLKQEVEQNPNGKLEDFANLFKVSKNAISLAFKILNITRKKRLIYTKNEMKKSVEYFWQT